MSGGRHGRRRPLGELPDVIFEHGERAEQVLLQKEPGRSRVPTCDCIEDLVMLFDALRQTAWGRDLRCKDFVVLLLRRCWITAPQPSELPH